MGIVTNKLSELKNEKVLIELTNKINTKLPKNCKIYLNQLNCAINGIEQFDSNLPRPNHLIVKGKTQAGKTGVLTSMIMLINELKLEKAMSIQRIYYITGDNGCRLVKQTRERIEHCFEQENNTCKFFCLKNSQLKNDILNKEILTNSLIFIDESHYGTSNEKNILIKWMESKSINMHNDKELVEKSVYIVSNSATPYGEINSDCAGCKSCVILNTDDWNGEKGYVGFKEYDSKNCIVSVKNNINKNNIEEICEDLIEHLGRIKEETGKTKCGIIRISKKIFNNCREVLEKYFHVETFFSNTNNINYAEIENKMEHDCDTWDKPLLFVICGAYRMGVSISSFCKKNIGFVYDYATGNSKTNIVTTEQGLMGRVTGYWETNDWHDILIYINEKHYNSLKSCYVEHVTSTPMVDIKEKFEPKENGSEIGIISENDYIEIPCSKIFNGKEYNREIKNYLESEGFIKFGKKLPEDVVWLPGRRNNENYVVKFTEPVFSLKEDGAKSILKKEENINKICYTTLYEMKDGIIKVKYGKIVRGERVKTYDENTKIIESLKTE